MCIKTRGYKRPNECVKNSNVYIFKIVERDDKDSWFSPELSKSNLKVYVSRLQGSRDFIWAILGQEMRHGVSLSWIKEGVKG